MKIVHVAPCAGGTGPGIGAYRLHSVLRRMGHESTMFVAENRVPTRDGAIKIFDPPVDVISRVRRRIRAQVIERGYAGYRKTRPKGHEPFSDDRSAHGADWVRQFPQADVVNVHGMYGFIDYEAFFASVPSRMPVVRTLRDMSFFTGGCHCDEYCGKFVSGCGACPQLGSHTENDLSRRIWNRKRAALRSVASNRLYLVSPSRWLAGEAARSPMLGNFNLRVIPHGIDMTVLKPRDRAFARDTLGIPPDSRVLLFVGNPSRGIKGFTILIQALAALKEMPGLFLLIVGGGRSPVEPPIPQRHFGFVGDEGLLSLIHSAADALVIPSYQENFPYTALEALACGTPVIGSAVGGIPDMVRENVTGLLVPPRDAAALQNAIRQLLEQPETRTRMAANCRRIALEEYTLELHARRYLDLYREVLGIEEKVSA